MNAGRDAHIPPHIHIMKKDIQTSLPITKKNIYRIAVWPHIWKWLLAFVPLALLLVIMGIGRRMSFFSTIGSILAIGVFLMVFCLPQLLTQSKALVQLSHVPDFDLLFKDKQLYWKNGAWGYADNNWFIRVSRNHCAVLRASEIDFSVPVRGFSDSYNVSKGLHLNLCHLVFTCPDGKTIFVCSEADQNITNWIRWHGGILAGKKKKR